MPATITFIDSKASNVCSDLQLMLRLATDYKRCPAKCIFVFGKQCHSFSGVSLLLQSRL
eukprot:m.16803 g.16803  ORF g.16803 m.16803 type:complete len:59 (+) comp11028_c0_seq1:216-392(+)